MPPTLKIEEWAKDKNPVIAYYAINNALIARQKCEALRHIKERRVYNHHFPLPDLPSWHSMYQSRKPIYAYKRLISNTSDYSTVNMDMFKAF